MDEMEFNAFLAADRKKHAKRYEELTKLYQIASIRELTSEEKAYLEILTPHLRTEETPDKYCRPSRRAPDGQTED